MNTITIEREGHFLAGLGWGALIGGLIAITLGVAARDQSNGEFGALILVVVAGITLATSIVTGAIIGAIQGIDSFREIDGAAKNYHDAVPLLKKNSIFSAFPPPELARLTVLH